MMVGKSTAWVYPLKVPSHDRTKKTQAFFTKHAFRPMVMPSILQEIS